MNLYPKNPHLLNKIWAKKQPLEAQTLPQPNSVFSTQQLSKTKSLSLIANLSEEPTLRQDNQPFSQPSKSQQPSQKSAFSDTNSSQRQARPCKAEVHQAPNSAIIIITDNANVSSDQSGGESPDSGQGDGESDGGDGGSGSKTGELPPGVHKKIKRECDHHSHNNPNHRKPCHVHPQRDKPHAKWPKRVQSNTPSNQNNNSFEIESECSTNDMQCEEIHEFSPFMGFSQCSRDEFNKMEEFKLDDESYYQDSTTCSDEDQSYLKEAFEIATHFEGICSSRHCPSEKALLKFMCKLGHSFELNLGELREKWCPRCHKSLENLREYAKSHNGKVLNTYYSDRITYECAKGHSWNIGHKNAQRRWCSQCAKQERAAVKQQNQQESQRKQTIDSELQKRLFEEARKNNAQAHPNIPNATSQTSISDAKKNMIDYFEKIEANVDRLARKQTSEFVTSQGFNGQCTKEQVLQVFKVVLMPDEIYKSYMFNLPLDALKADFRRLVKLIHPDKNKHPQAGIAFQKVYKIYELAVSKLSPAAN